MSIEKLDFSYIKQEKKTFTTHLNSVLQNLKNPEALGVWAYLSSLPETWVVNKEHLRKHFGIGRDKLDRILSYLEQNELLETGQETLADGKFGKGYILIKCGYEFENKLKSYPQEQPFTEKPLTAEPYTENPCHGKSAPINKIINTNKTKTERARKKRVPLPPDFYPDANNILKLKETSAKSGLTEEALLTKFRNWYTSKNEKHEDWQAILNNFLINEKPQRLIKTDTTKQSLVTASGNPVGAGGAAYYFFDDPRHPNYAEYMANKEWESKKITEKPYARSQGSEVARDNTRRDSVRKAASYLPRRESMD